MSLSLMPFKTLGFDGELNFLLYQRNLFPGAISPRKHKLFPFNFMVLATRQRTLMPAWSTFAWSILKIECTSH
jgi:hypothetical protein